MNNTNIDNQSEYMYPA